jgi:hypothetical protein
MTTTDLYAATLSVLTDARRVMLSPEWQVELDKHTQAERVAASKALVQVEQTILRLSNAILSDIAEQMQENEEALTHSTKELETALERIQKVKSVIDKVTDVLNVVVKILPLL